MKRLSVVIILFALAGVSPAQTFTVLHGFTNNPDGKRPETGLALSGNTLYGTTIYGGSASQGTVFKVNTDGSGYAVVHYSSTPDWVYPKGVIVSRDTLYGTTEQGGTGIGYGYGTVFKMKTDGSDYTVIKMFTNSDGAYPEAGLVLSGDTLYGTTASGGSWNAGTVFKVNTDGSGFSILYSFSARNTNNTDGTWPAADLTLDGSTLYGTTLEGGNGLYGTVFRLNTDGSDFTVLHSFSHVDLKTHANADGALPRGRLALGGDTLYGTTSAGGPLTYGTAFKVNTNGSGFTVLYNFLGDSSFDIGAGPWAGLTLSGSTLYGASLNEGSRARGRIFKVNTDGSDYAVLYSFSPPTYFPQGQTNWDGGLPLAGLVLDGHTLYGAAAVYGSAGRGTVFSLQLPDEAPPPVISSVLQTNGTFTFTWRASAGSSYQVQYKTDIVSSNWSDLGEILTATNETLSASDAIGPDLQRFYRVVLLLP